MDMEKGTLVVSLYPVSTDNILLVEELLKCGNINLKNAHGYILYNHRKFEFFPIAQNCSLEDLQEFSKNPTLCKILQSLAIQCTHLEEKIASLKKILENHLEDPMGHDISNII